MKNVKMTLAMAATAAMLAACGGGGSGSNEGQNPGVPSTPPAADTLNRTNTPGVYADSARKYAFDTLNQVRGITGVGFLKQNEALDKAAQAHADYIRLNPGNVGHTENSEHAGFTGKTPDERARHFGYTHGASEVLAGSGSDMPPLWKLLGVPYHSIDMLDTYADIGVGVWPKAILVMNPGKYSAQLLNGSFVAVYPCNDMQVNVQGQGYEMPLPSVLNGKQDFGYSSVALVRLGQTLEVSSWELRDASGNAVPTVLMTRANDANKRLAINQASLIPLNALPRTATTYTSVLKGKNNGVPFEKTCAWRTVAGETVPSN